MKPLVVRVADERDLGHPYVGGPAGEYRPQLSAIMRGGTGVVLVGELDGEIVGRITVTTTARDADISGFVVDEPSRRQGIGTTLIEAAEAEGPAPRLHARCGSPWPRRTRARSRCTRAGATSGSVKGEVRACARAEGVVIHEPEPVWRMIKPVG